MKKWGIDVRFLRSMAALFILGMTLGAMAVNVLADSSVDRAGILSDYFLRQYKYLEIDTTELFLYIMGKRMKWIFLLWIAGFTVAGLPCAAVYVLWMGFSAGTLMGVAVLKLGIQGIIFTAAALFPQTLCYVPAWIFFLNGIYLRGGVRTKRPGAGNSLARYVLLGVAMCLFMVFGILIESSLNPWFVRQILQLIQ